MGKFISDLLFNLFFPKERLFVRHPKNKKIKRLAIYLSGSTTETHYRRIFKNYYSLNVKIQLLDPLNFQSDNYKEIVQNDIDLINECDFVVSYIQKLTAGTLMEVVYAYLNKKPIYVITDKENIKNDIWIKYHTKKFFNSIESCIKFIDKNLRSLED